MPEVETKPGKSVRSGVRAVGRLQAQYPIAQVVCLAAIFAYGAATLTDFTSRLGIYSMLVIASLLGMAASGQTLVVLIGGVDLSIAGWIAAGSSADVQLTGVDHWPFIAVLAVVLAVAAVIGALTGYVAHRFNVHPLIVTLAVGSIVGGAVLVWTKGFITGSPQLWLKNLSSPAGTTFGLQFPPVVLIWAATAILVGVVLRRTVVGRRLYATGANPAAAEFALVNTRRIWMGCFAASAILSTCTGILLAGFAGGADTTLGQPYLFESLTAVIVGGTAFGAIGDYSRTVIAALLLTVLTTVLIGNGLTAPEQQVVFGVLIFVFVAFYGRESRLRDRV